MAEDDFKDIVCQLAALGYQNRVTLYLKNEPLMDKRMVDLVRYTRGKLLKNHLFLSTNGDLLTEKLASDLVNAGLDTLKVSAYDRETHKKVLGWPGVKVWAFYDHGTDEFNNRGGLVDVGGDECGGMCLRPFQQMYIDYDGKAVLCCSDYKREVIMGDVIEDGLWGVWNNDKYAKYRKWLRRGRRDKLRLCKMCNYHGGGVNH
jgi:radical SAM protein with 4Fe4S-binding SPASM domain